jgi:hypothetical protein
MEFRYYFSLNNQQKFKSRRIRLTGNISCMGKERVYTGFWWGNLRERDHFEGPGVDGRIILRWIFRKWIGGIGLNLSGLGYGRVADSCECGNEYSCYIMCGEFLD